MRVIPWAAIAIPLLTQILIPVIQGEAQAATPTSKDVIVEIKVAPHQQPWLPTMPSPTVAPAAPVQFPSFNSQQLDRQLQRYLTYLEQHGTPDILIVGSSRALQGVDPLMLQTALAQQGYHNLKVFNFGINGATAQVVNWLLNDLLSSDQLPRLLVWADGSRAFNSGRVDHTFNKVSSSKGHQQLLAKNRPVTRTASLKLGQVCMDLLSLQLPEQTAKSRQSLRSAQINPQRPVGQAGSSITYCQRPIRFMVQPGVSPPPDMASEALESLGFQIVNQQFNPDRYFQRYPRVSGRFDGDYRAFNLQGVQGRALENVARFANARKIPLVFVNLPLTVSHLDPTRRFYEDQFRSHMQQTAQSQQFSFLDLSRVQSLMQNQYFADPSHLNRLGAAAIATQLGKHLPLLNLPLLHERDRKLSQNSATPASLEAASPLTIRILSSTN